MSNRLTALAAVAAVLALPADARAQSYTWNQTTAGNWSTATWSPTGPPVGGAATILNFADTASSYTATNDIGPFTLNALNLSNTGTTTIAGSVAANTLTFAGSNAALNLSSGAGAATITSGVVFSANTTVTNDSGSLLTLGGAVTYNASTTTAFAGAGNITLGGAQTFKAGTAAAPTRLTYSGGGTLTVGPTTGTGITFGNNTTITNGGSGTLTLADGGTYAGSNVTVNLANSGTGTFNIGNIGPVSGTLNIAAGTVRFNPAGNAGGDLFGASLTLNVATGATFDFSGNAESMGAIAGSGTIQSTVGLTMGLTGNKTWGGVIQGTGGSFATGAANVNYTFTGNNTYTGATTVVASSSLTLGNGGPGGSIGTGALTLNGMLTFNRSDDYTFGNSSSTTTNQAGVMIKNGAGTVFQTGNLNNFVGTLTINAGTFVSSNPSGTHNLNATSIVVNGGGTYQFGSSTPVSGENPNLADTTSYITINTGGTVNWYVGETFGGINVFGGTLNLITGGNNWSGTAASELRAGSVIAPGSVLNITGTAVVNKTTPGTVTLAGVNLNNTGGVNIQDGVLSTNAGLTATGTLTFGTATTTGTLQYTGPSGSLAKPAALNDGGGVIEVTNAGTELTYSGATSGAGLLTKAGPGTLTLTGNNVHTGGTAVTGGTLQVGNGGTVGVLPGDVSLGAGGTLAFNRSDDFTFAGNLSGAGGVSKLGPDAVTLGGALMYTGPTQVTAGTLRVSPLATSGVVVAAGATLAVKYGPTPGPLTAGTLDLGAGGATLKFELNSAGNPTTPLVNVTTTDGLTLNGGTHTLTVGNAQQFAVGQFPLIDYAGTPVTDGFTLAGLPARTLGDLVYNAANTSIDLRVTAIDSIGWTGAVNGDWDVGTAVNAGGTPNWKLASNGSATNFIPNDVVLFDDTSAVRTVNVTTQVRPGRVTVNTVNTYTFQGPGTITGGASLTKQGTGTLVVLTNNDNTGGTTVTAGTLQVGNGDVFGAIGSGPLVNNGAVVFNRSDDVTYTGDVTGTGTLTKLGAGNLTVVGPYTPTGNTTVTAGTLTLSAALPFTYAGTISGAGALAKSGPAVVTLTGNNTYAGGTTVSAGTLQVGDGGTTGTPGTGDVGVAGGATLLFARSDAVTFPGGITGPGKVTQAGPGTTVLTGVLSYTGATTVSGGTLQFGDGTAPTLLPGNAAVQAAGTLVLDPAADQTYAAVLSGAGAIVKQGPATLTLTASNTFTGTFTINGGRVILQDVAGGDLNATAIVVNDGGAFQFGVASGENPDLPDATIITVNVGGTFETRVGENFGGVNLQGGTVFLNGAGYTAVAAAQSWTSGTITGTTAAGGSAPIFKTTSGTVVVDGAVTLSPVLNIQDGTVAFVTAANLGSAAVTLGTAGAGGTTGTFEYRGATATRAGAFTLTGPGVVKVTDSAAALTLSGVVSGAGSLTKDGPGTLILTGANTYSGTTAVAAGTLQVGATGTLGTGATTVAAGAGLVFNRSNALTYGGAISGAGTVAQAGTATLILTGANTYTGGTAVTAGTLQVGAGGTAGTLGAGDASVAAGAGLVFSRSNALTYGGVISGAGAVAQAGAGTLTLSGANTYTGPTTVSAGTLLVAGNSSAATGAVAVSGGALGGTGTVGGPVAVSSTGTITAGTALATRTLTLGSTLTLDGAKYTVTLFGTGNDTASLIATAGDVTLTNTPTLGLNLNGQTPDGLRAAGPATYTILTGGTVTGAFAAPDFTAQGFAPSEWSLTMTPTTAVLNFNPTPVPEPAAVLGLAALAFGAAGLRRRFGFCFRA